MNTQRPLGYFQEILASVVSSGRRLTQRMLDQQSALETLPFPALVEAVLAARGESLALLQAETLLRRYENADDAEKSAFFLLLAEDYGIDADSLVDAASRYRESRNTTDFQSLNKAMNSRRQDLFRRLNAVPGGTVRLVAMRQDLLGLLGTMPELAPLDFELKQLFTSWFNRGFLVMRPIDWSTPATILEKIIAYEAVHAIDDWEELRRRLEPEDRRCFAFFHPAMQDEPLIFVEVALTEHWPDSIQDLLTNEREILPPHKARNAVFYSISNCQRGLAGISFGSFLIKQVASDLQQEWPNLRDFLTLSPVPGLMKWCRQQAEENTDETLKFLQKDFQNLHESNSNENIISILDYHREKLGQLAARYLAEEEAGNGLPADPVARFHLGNGAQLERINLQADLSANGLRQSAGVMVNYHYDLPKVEERHEAFWEQGKRAVAPAVSRLAQSGRR